MNNTTDKWIRLTPAGTPCPISGYSRGRLAQLIKDGTIESVAVPTGRRGRGARLLSVASLRAYCAKAPVNVSAKNDTPINQPPRNEPGDFTDFVLAVESAEASKAEAESANEKIRNASENFNAPGRVFPVELISAQESARLAKMRADAATAQARQLLPSVFQEQKTTRRMIEVSLDCIRNQVLHRLEQTLRRAGFGDNWRVAAGLHPLSDEMHKIEASVFFEDISSFTKNGETFMAPRESFSSVAEKVRRMRAALNRAQTIQPPKFPV